MCILAKVVTKKDTDEMYGQKYLFLRLAKIPRKNLRCFFTLVNVVAVIQTWLISLGLAYYVLPWLGVTTYVNEIAHAVGIMVPVFSSFIGHKYLTFR